MAHGTLLGLASRVGLSLALLAERLCTATVYLFTVAYAPIRRYLSVQL
jgi:hypothetical protein